jgi:predicted nucleotidyltransferase
MTNHLRAFQEFLNEAEDPSYYQDTFYFTILISMSKDIGGSRDETKNDIRALPEILTVTLVEAEKGGVQRDIGTKYLSTLKIHARRPKNINKQLLMKRIVLHINNLRGVTVLRYKERKAKPRRKAFHGTYNINEEGYQQNPARKKRLKQAFNRYTKTGPNSAGPYKDVTDDPDWKSAPPGAPGGLEEASLAEAMKGIGELPEDVVVVIRKGMDSSGFRVYFALRDDPYRALKPGDLDRLEAGIDIYGVLRVSEGRNFPYEGVYIITSSKVKDGYGPLLYDVAMETAGAAGLKPDTLTVSDDASAVWKHYDTQRPEVDSSLLVMDLDQYNTVMPDDRAAAPEASEHLAKAYFKKDRSTLKELNTVDKLVELSGPAPAPKAPKISSQDLSRYDRLRENIRIRIGHRDPLFAFDVKDHLNEQIWEGDRAVRPGVKGALMAIVDEFLEGLDLEMDVKDVIITGSIANYNWSKFSDIDIHILVDFGEVNENEAMVKRFFDSVRSTWNKLHNITVKGHEVEIYVQDAQEPHVSTGVYSLKEDRWLVKPQKMKPELDKRTATKKMKSLAREIGKLSSLLDHAKYEETFEGAQRLKDKIRRMRRAGLEKTGIYSPENLAFKMLRRSGDIEQLFSVYTQAYDQLYSLDQ